MFRKKLLLLFMLAVAVHFATAQDVDPFIKESTVSHVKREMKKTKNLVVKANKKKYLKENACSPEKDLMVLPIFWMVGEKEDLNLSEASCSRFFDKLRFCTRSGRGITVGSGKRLDFRDLFFEGLVYDTCLNVLALYNRTKIKSFYSPRVPTRLLFRAIIDNDIKNLFYILNFDRHHPYFLVDREGRILVYTNHWSESLGYMSSVVELGEYLEKIHNKEPFPLRDT